MSLRTLHRLVGGVIAVNVLVAAATQAFAHATGRDFVFGLIPAFDPAGTRNLLTWQSSMLLGSCSGLAAYVAGTRALMADRSALGWWTLATVLGGYSMAWMTGLAGVIFGDFVPAAAALSMLAAGGAVVAVIGLFLTRRGASPAIPMAVWLAFPLLVASRESALYGDSAAVAALIGRTIEWFGIACLLLAGGSLLAEQAPRLSLTVESARPNVLRLTRTPHGNHLALDAAALGRWLARSIMVLSVLSLGSAWLALRYGADAERWYRFTFVDFEGNLPTWASSVLLLACAVASGLVGASERTRGAAAWTYWAAMSVGFVALSADEAASLHELMVQPLRTLLSGSAWLRYPLIVPGTVVALAAVAVFGRFVQRLPTGTRRALIGGGGLFLFGALGLETAGGWFDPELHGNNLPYVLLATCEEACEMAGVTVALIGILRHIEYHVGPVEMLVVGDRDYGTGAA